MLMDDDGGGCSRYDRTPSSSSKVLACGMVSIIHMYIMVVVEFGGGGCRRRRGWWRRRGGKTRAPLFGDTNTYSYEVKPFRSSLNLIMAGDC
jgi:hypothetical protein